jgi:hypothetical protein
MEGQTIQWPSERRVNGRTNKTMAIRKKDRQHKPSEKKTKRQTMVYKTINRKRKSEQHDYPLNNWGETKWS